MSIVGESDGDQLNQNIGAGRTRVQRITAHESVSRPTVLFEHRHRTCGRLGHGQRRPGQAGPSSRRIAAVLLAAEHRRLEHLAHSHPRPTRQNRRVRLAEQRAHRQPPCLRLSLFRKAGNTPANLANSQATIGRSTIRRSDVPPAAKKRALDSVGATLNSAISWQARFWTCCRMSITPSPPRMAGGWIAASSSEPLACRQPAQSLGDLVLDLQLHLETADSASSAGFAWLGGVRTPEGPRRLAALSTIEHMKWLRLTGLNEDSAPDRYKELG